MTVREVRDVVNAAEDAWLDLPVMLLLETVMGEHDRHVPAKCRLDRPDDCPGVRMAFLV